MSGQNKDGIDILIFDDNACMHEPLTKDAKGTWVPLIPCNVIILKSEYTVQWPKTEPHEFYSGRWAGAPFQRLMNEQRNFDDALEFCHKGPIGRAIALFDMKYDKIAVTEDHVESVGELARSVFGPTVESNAEAAKKFNEDNQGALLAVALIQNPKADCDIYLYSSAQPEYDGPLGVLAELARDQHVGRFKGSVHSYRSGQMFGADLKEAIETYVRIRDLPDPGIWPQKDEGNRCRWFLGRNELVPHDRPSEPPKPLLEYLEALGLDNEKVAIDWLSTDQCYEALKTLVGSGATAETGGKKVLRLGALLFPLLKAVGGKGWTRTVDWAGAGGKGGPKICGEDKEASRRLVIRAYTLFREMACDKNGNRSHDVRTQFDGGHLYVDIGPGWDCTNGRESRSLLARCFTFAFTKPDGEATKAVYGLLSAIWKEGDGRLDFALYPVDKGDGRWVRLDFFGRG